MNKKHTPKMWQAKRLPTKKEASHFVNMKHTPKNARGSKTSDEKRGTTFYDSDKDPKNKNLGPRVIITMHSKMT
jgi:hypothetical protein